MMWKQYNCGGLKYIVSEYGDVIGCSRNKIIKKGENKDGYYVVTLGSGKHRRRYSVHHIVAELFVEGMESGLEVNHKDFNRKNNYYKNLEWVTHKDNIKKSSLAGRYNRPNGESNGRCKIKEENVIKMREEYENGASIAFLSRKYKIGYTQTSRIVKYESWKYLQ